ncbi:NADP-dependent oxidoreductase [Parafrankia sp. BMG5.11]|uniref:NADP-dependent oxidoreductase n=1 Tax=Parafrankia sp. BMG5.11 TaxID=222540 RepID=UPI00103B3192|nr:NADP-dependent oxidoreductase [Parafrankia sp. BMG5.11]TCJ37059.1 NADP-dependent oxidoreductase [Parafrankia sp. BMG5.11]
MRAIAMTRFGGPDVLFEADLPRPVARSGEVVVQVAYAAVNPADWKVREGWLAPYFSPVFPFVPGFDASGWVAQVGDGVEDLVVGDRVVCATNQGLGENGAYAEFVRAAADRIVQLSDTVTLADAATLPTAGMTAWEAVCDVGRVSASQLVLVNGGAGGTGSFAVQLAKMRGARVAAICRRENFAYVQAMGAERTIDYREGSVLDAVHNWAPRGVDLVVDTVGQGSLAEGLAILGSEGLIAHIATLISGERRADPETAARSGKHVALVSSSFPNQPHQLRGLVEALADDRIVAPARQTFPLERAADAQARIQGGHVRGKLLLEVARE